MNGRTFIGWARPPGARKDHFFSISLSFCRKWEYTGELKIFSDERCKDCQARLDLLREMLLDRPF